MSPRTYLCNAFSAQMLLPLTRTATLNYTPVEPQEVATSMLHDEHTLSAIGHADHAALVSKTLSEAMGFPIHVPVKRESISLRPGDTLYLAQFTGGRLPEGCSALPEGCTLQFIRVIYL